MSVQILTSKDGESCLYCSTSEWAFGPIFHLGEDAQDFLNWLVEDPRHLNDRELENRVAEWREEIEQNAGASNFTEPYDYREDR